MESKALKFYNHLAKEILAGRKTVTWRLFDDKNLTVGDLLEFIITESKEKFAQAEITGIREKKLGEVEEIDFLGHERYESRENMLEHYKGYYGDKVTFETPIKIISFRLL